MMKSDTVVFCFTQQLICCKTKLSHGMIHLLSHDMPSGMLRFKIGSKIINFLNAVHVESIIKVDRTTARPPQKQDRTGQDRTLQTSADT